LVYVSRETRDPKRLFLPHGAFFEKFLFYRGIGNFDLPLKLTSFEEGRFELHNTGQLPIRSLFLATVDGPSLRYAKYDAIAPGERLELRQARESRTADQLGEDMARSLQAAGLYKKEALAMVNTWRDSWFREQGTRLFYLLPQESTEALLPLTVSPLPDEMLRVMVGRLEIMRPEDEARITALVKQSASDRAKYVRELDQRPYAFPRAIKDLGRLTEPALLRVKNLTRDPTVHAETNLLLWELRNL